MATAIGVVIGLALGLAIIVGISLGIVYGLMWLLADLLGLPYAAASSTAFAILSVFVVLGAITQFFKADNKGLGFTQAVLSILVGPLTYAASFRAHATWTDADLGGSRYLPGEYWQQITDASGWAVQRLATAAPALGDSFQAVQGSPLLTQIVASAVSGIALAFGQQLFRRREA